MGRVAIVTGAAGAIGRAICERLVRDGLTVLAADLDTGQISEVLGVHDLLVPHQLDVTDEDSIDTAVHRAHYDLGGELAVVVNNAGITRDSTLHKMTLEDFRAVIRVNLEGPFLVSRAAARIFREHSGEHRRIINMSSISGKLGLFGQSNYSSSKAGLAAMTKVAARELARYQVTANAILPGFIDTPMTQAMPPDIYRARIEAIPVGRAGQPEDVADLVAWLAGTESSYMTGATLELTGGKEM
jgi:3-oxoacyl-[acyl-carrier protein] reductase